MQKTLLAEQKTELEELREKMSADLQKITQYIMKKSPEAEELMKKLKEKNKDYPLIFLLSFNYSNIIIIYFKFRGVKTLCLNRLKRSLPVP